MAIGLEMSDGGIGSTYQLRWDVKLTAVPFVYMLDFARSCSYDAQCTPFTDLTSMSHQLEVPENLSHDSYNEWFQIHGAVLVYHQ